jgi:hypothetical protein
MHPSHLYLHYFITAVAFGIVMPFNAVAADPTPDPAEPYVTSSPGSLSVPVAVDASTFGAPGAT